MSLDVYLIAKLDPPHKEHCYSCGSDVLRETEEVYERNITHNLSRMADEAGIYEALWCPQENGFQKAAQLVEPLTRGLDLLRSDPERFKTFNPANNWGCYDGLVNFVQSYLAACIEYPEAEVKTWR